MPSKLIDPRAITSPLVAGEPAYDFKPLGQTNLDWCNQEVARLASKGDTARVERRGRLCWVTRAKAKAKDNGKVAGK